MIYTNASPYRKQLLKIENEMQKRSIPEFVT